ncbi:MAG: hypothetical protein ABSD10_03310 [Candidatus Saccharimonadales bacterium]|jgi:ABC-type Na+ efflux pump permease subunit
MGLGLISFLFTLGAGTWIYTKLQRYNGNNTKQSVIAAAVAAVIIFLIMFSILSLIIKK